MSQSYHFNGYTVRPVNELDRVYLERLIEADEYHRGRVNADFFMRPLPGETSWALEAPTGKVIFYFKTTPVVRMAIQFAGDETLQQKGETAEALMRGLAWIENTFRNSLFREIIFDVDGPDLAHFAKRRLGFVDARNLLSRSIDPRTGPAMPPRAVGTVPTSTSREEQ